MPLVTSKGTGVISFNTDPVEVTVYLDGEEYAIKTPAAINNVPIGEHTYTLRKDGFLDYTSSTIVEDTQLCCINVDMRTSEKAGTCSTEVVPSYEVPTISTKQDYGMLVVGLLIGILFVKLIDKK